MIFEKRSALGEGVAEIINKEIFADSKFIVEKFGVEKTHKEIARQLYLFGDDKVSMFIRYFPDYLLMDKARKKTSFLEYKAMVVPAKEKRVEWLRNLTGIDDLSVSNVGIIEREAIDNYFLLSKSGFDVVIIVACRYNPKVLLAEWSSNLIVIYRQPERIKAGPLERANILSKGSGTPWVNIHLDRMRTLRNFLKDEFDFDVCTEKAKDSIVKFFDDTL